MWQDDFDRYSNAQAVTATAVSEDVIDHRAIRNLGVGEKPLYVVVQVTTAMTDAGSDSTITVTIETDDSDTFGSATVSQTLGTFAALSAVGTRLTVAVAHGALNERYSRLRYTTANGNLTTGSFSAVLTADPQAWTAYADATTYTT